MSQQMPTVYPVTDTVPLSNHSSNGSYGSVFIVLAIIVAVSAFACFFGRFCNKNQDVGKPSTKEKDRKRNSNGFQTKDGDIEFGYDKRFASAKIATTANEPTARPNPFGDSNMARPNSFRDHPTTDRPNSIRQPALGQTNSFHKTNKVGPSSFDEPTSSTGRPSSFHEPTMGQSNSFHGQSQGDQVRYGDDDRADNGINFKFRTRAQRY